jgi:hypothetical protein
MQKNKKLYYTPGMICLLILPFLFIYKAQIYQKQINQSAIVLFMPDTKMYKESMKAIKGTTKHKRHYVEINLTDSFEDNEIKLSYAQLRVREILAANDGVNGVHLKLSDSTPYGTFIRAIDILRVEGAKRYMAFDNDIWFLHEPPDTSAETIQSWVCGFSASYEKKEPSNWQILQKKISMTLKSSWQLIITFSAFFFFSLYSIKRSRKVFSLEKEGLYI